MLLTISIELPSRTGPNSPERRNLRIETQAVGAGRLPFPSALSLAAMSQPFERITGDADSDLHWRCMARCAVPARVVAGGTKIRATLVFEGVAPLHAARTSQRDVPTTLNTYQGEGIAAIRVFFL